MEAAKGDRLAAPTAPPPQLARLPPPLLPWLYLALAQAALVLTFAALAIRPGQLGGFYYHARALALVHLITLGWVTCNILGSLYLVGPFALRARFPGGRLGGTAFMLVAVGVVGMIGHFWIDEYSGMIWSAGTLLAGIALVAGSVLPALLRSRVHAAVKVHVALAFANVLAAGLLGSLVGLEKLGALALPGPVLGSVHAHAHLAGLGWATMMVMGVGYRLLPMQLPSVIPPGSGPVAGAWLLEIGIVGLVVTLMLGSPWAWLFALSIVAALALFGQRVAWMLRNRRPAPPELPRPDLGVAQTLQALLYLAVAVALGLTLLAIPASETSIRLAFAYGVAFLLGFLGQIIVGVGNRLLPMVAWTHALVASGFTPPEVGMHRVVDRRLQGATLLGWSAGVPALGAGLALGRTPAIRIGAALLLVAALAEGWNRWRVFRLARVR